jgi:hypothetical protein
MTSVLVYDNIRYPFSNILEYWVHKDKLVKILIQASHYEQRLSYTKYDTCTKTVEAKFNTFDECWRFMDQLDQACISPCIFDLEKVKIEVRNENKNQRQKQVILDGGDAVEQV